MKPVIFFKKALAFTSVSLILLSVLSACDHHKAAPVTQPITAAPEVIITEPATEAETIPTKETIPEIQEYVTDQYFDSCPYNTMQYNSDLGKSEEVTVTAEYHIPQINLPGQTVQQINQELYDKLYPAYRSSMQCFEEFGYLMTFGMSYTWTVNGDILSLLTINQFGPEYGSDHYMVYNVSISTGERASNADVITAAGITEAEYFDRARDIMKQEFWAYWGTDDPTFESETMEKFVKEQEQKTLAQSNIEQAMPYFNEKGQLCIIARRYAIAGGSDYQDNLNLIDYVPFSY